MGFFKTRKNMQNAHCSVVVLARTRRQKNLLNSFVVTHRTSRLQKNLGVEEYVMKNKNKFCKEYKADLTHFDQKKKRKKSENNPKEIKKSKGKRQGSMALTTCEGIHKRTRKRNKQKGIHILARG